MPATVALSVAVSRALVGEGDVGSEARGGRGRLRGLAVGPVGDRGRARPGVVGAADGPGLAGVRGGRDGVVGGPGARERGDRDGVGADGRARAALEGADADVVGAVHAGRLDRGALVGLGGAVVGRDEGVAVAHEAVGGRPGDADGALVDLDVVVRIGDAVVGRDGVLRADLVGADVVALGIGHLDVPGGERGLHRVALREAAGDEADLVLGGRGVAVGELEGVLVGAVGGHDLEAQLAGADGPRLARGVGGHGVVGRARRAARGGPQAGDHGGVAAGLRGAVRGALVDGLEGVAAHGVGHGRGEALLGAVIGEREVIAAGPGERDHLRGHRRGEGGLLAQRVVGRGGAGQGVGAREGDRVGRGGGVGRGEGARGGGAGRDRDVVGPHDAHEGGRGVVDGDYVGAVVGAVEGAGARDGERLGRDGDRGGAGHVLVVVAGDGVGDHVVAGRLEAGRHGLAGVRGAGVVGVGVGDLGVVGPAGLDADGGQRVLGAVVGGGGALGRHVGLEIRGGRLGDGPRVGPGGLALPGVVFVE